jgi:hypothetical protein
MISIQQRVSFAVIIPPHEVVKCGQSLKVNVLIVVRNRATIVPQKCQLRQPPARRQRLHLGAARARGTLRPPAIRSIAPVRQNRFQV